MTDCKAKLIWIKGAEPSLPAWICIGTRRRHEASTTPQDTGAFRQTGTDTGLAAQCRQTLCVIERRSQYSQGSIPTSWISNYRLSSPKQDGDGMVGRER